MRIALVHELLTMRGGAERVLRVLADMFPEAPIYTLLYDERKLGDWFPRERVRTSSLQKYATVFGYNHHLYLPFFPKAVEAWDFSDFDLVISSSSAFAHGIITTGKTKHLCYVHSPARYLWDRTHDVLNRVCPVGARHAVPLRHLKRRYLERTFHKLREWDAEAGERPDKILAASKAVQRRIELYWRRESTILYPPVDDWWFQTGRKNGGEAARFQYVNILKTGDNIWKPGGEGFFLVVSTLVPYKRIDLAIEACNACSIPLKIVGEGPDRKRLQAIANRCRNEGATRGAPTPTVQFLGFQPEERLKELYTDAAAVIFPGDEDFGIVPLEAMACGTPVIAYRGGGALETIGEGETGAFFDEPTAASLTDALRRFRSDAYDPDVCRTHARQFSRERFDEGIRRAVRELTGG